MKVIYDPAIDTLSIILRDVPVKESDELREGLIIDYGEDGKAVSIELLDATENVAEPKGIHLAENDFEKDLRPYGMETGSYIRRSLSKSVARS